MKYAVVLKKLFCNDSVTYLFQALSCIQIFIIYLNLQSIAVAFLQFN